VRGLEREVGSVKSWASLIQKTRQCFAGLPNPRKGKNTIYSMEDFATSALSVFFMQSPSFLAYQETMQQNKGRSNAQTLFQMEKIPCENQTRETLDEVAPEEIFPLYDEVLEAFKEQGVLEQYRTINGTIAIALDGTWYHSSFTLSLFVNPIPTLGFTNGWTSSNPTRVCTFLPNASKTAGTSNITPTVSPTGRRSPPKGTR
jgi:hypothetical protein